MIREVTEKDAAQIAEIYNHYILHSTASFEVVAVSVAEMEGRIASLRDFPYYVWEEEGRLLGYCYAHPWKPRAAYSPTLETTIYLRPEATGRGIGLQLMERLIPECRRRGYRVLIADITAENTASRAFHESLGFRQISHFERVGQKFGRSLDVVDYQLDL